MPNPIPTPAYPKARRPAPSGHYYNENAPYPAQWLRNLMVAGQIPWGHVDERSIREVQPDDLRGYGQCHFFAGIGGWPLALRLAGWPAGRRVWTASVPCQPWSRANTKQGSGRGESDRRHLWPDYLGLVRQSRPPVMFGEQVADAIALGWLDGVCVDLEREGYAVASAVLPAYAVGAAHQRNRLYWVAYARGKGWAGHQSLGRLPRSTGAAHAVDGDPLTHARRALAGDIGGLLPCDGLSVVVERDAVKGYGNAIVPQAAAEFVAAYLDAEREVAA
jgi:DNA (cytosine-5)-methyltransferase 1